MTSPIPPHQLDALLPAGNIRMLGKEEDTVYLAPDLRDTVGHWFYWKFRVRGAAGKILTFRFEGGPCLTSRGPVYSRDRGASWHWLSDTPDAPEDHFRFTFAADDHEVWFCMCLPYGLEEWNSFLAEREVDGRVTSLCTTPAGRPVPLLEMDGDSRRPRIVLTARHHCCETPPNFVLEGFVRRWSELRAAPLAVVPFMDLDGVVDGDQGKNRGGRDHNRDYGPDSRYAEVRALKAWMREVRGPFLAFDLHAPFIRHGMNETVFFPGPEQPDQAGELARFSRGLEAHARGLPYRAADNLPFGEGWNTSKSYTAGLTCSKWMRRQDDCRLASTLEVPYANASGVSVTPVRAKQFGESLADAMAVYLTGEIQT